MLGLDYSVLTVHHVHTRGARAACAVPGHTGGRRCPREEPPRTGPRERGQGCRLEAGEDVDGTGRRSGVGEAKQRPGKGPNVAGAEGGAAELTAGPRGPPTCLRANVGPELKAQNTTWTKGGISP